MESIETSDKKANAKGAWPHLTLLLRSAKVLLSCIFASMIFFVASDIKTLFVDRLTPFAEEVQAHVLGLQHKMLVVKSSHDIGTIVAEFDGELYMRFDTSDLQREIAAEREIAKLIPSYAENFQYKVYSLPCIEDYQGWLAARFSGGSLKDYHIVYDGGTNE